MTEMLLLAQSERPDPDTWVGPGLLGLAVILAIAVAMVFLWKNMNKQLRRINFREDEAENGNDPHTQPH